MNFSGLSQHHQAAVWSYVSVYQCVGLSVRFLSSSVMSSSLPLPPVFSGKAAGCFPCVCRAGSGVDCRPGSVFRHLVAETGLGPEPIVLYLATAGGYFCYCCLILSDIVSVPSRGRCVCVCVCVYIYLCVCPCFKCAWSIESIAIEKRKSQTPFISTEVVF